MPIADRIRRARLGARLESVASPAEDSQLSSRALLGELEERYRLGLWFWDYKAKAFDWDAGLRRLNGVPMDAPLNVADVAWRRFIADDRWMIDSVIEHALPVSAWINVSPTPDGLDGYQLCHVKIFRDENGAPDLAIGFVQDVTGYKRLELAASSRARAGEAFFREIGLISWARPLDGPFLFAEGLAEFTGSLLTGLEGDALLRRIHPDDRVAIALWRAQLQSGAHGRPALTPRLRLRRGDDSYVEFRACGVAVELPWRGRPVESWSCLPVSAADEAPSSERVLTPRLLRAARGCLGWSVHELAERTGVSTATITRFEAGAALKPRSSTAIMDRLIHAGLELRLGPAGRWTLSFGAEAG